VSLVPTNEDRAYGRGFGDGLEAANPFNKNEYRAMAKSLGENTLKLIACVIEKHHVAILETMHECVRDYKTKITELESELARLRKVEARFQWITTYDSQLPDMFSGSELDAAIDAELAAAGEGAK